MPNYSGLIVGRYEIIDQLGFGGMAAVYLGRDTRLQRKVAIKFILTEMFPPVKLDEILKRFEREAQILAGLSHPNIVQIYDFGEHDSVPYVVMEYLDGGTLRQRMDKPLPYWQTAELLAPIANALAYAHREKIIHRDIKPANILLTSEGIPKISDFGIAKLLGIEQGVTLTGTGIGMGTPSYMAPEQWIGQSTPASDIYGLGVVLYQMLTGSLPFQADTPGELLMKVLNEPLPDLRAVAPELPVEVNRVIQTALSKQPEQRYANMQEMERALHLLSHIPHHHLTEDTLPADLTTQFIDFLPPDTAPLSSSDHQKNLVPLANTLEDSSESSQAEDQGPGKSTRVIPHLAWMVLAGVLILALLLGGFGLRNRSLTSAGSEIEPPQLQTQAIEADELQVLLDEPAEEGVTTPGAAHSTSTPESAANTKPFVVDPGKTKVCQVTDATGIDDRSFNETAWNGLLRAQEDFGVQIQYLESLQETDYEIAVNAFLEAECDLIVTVGFLLADATAAAAEANPDQPFAIVDVDYLDFPNVLGLAYSTHQAAFMAGYMAAGVSQTGVVATFGGIPIPPVTIFMDGFYLGVMHYNEVKGANVQVLGWNPATQEGLFVGNFESTDDGRILAESLMDEGADIILPVAGPVGLGSAAAAQERGNAWIIGVDSDWTLIASEYSDVILTSIMKLMDASVYDVTEQLIQGTFSGGVYVGTLENDGVGLGTVNPAVPAELIAEVEALRDEIIEGQVITRPENAPYDI
jgi:basic membrane protein A and related proteins